jgi:hypothetical protein
MILVHFKSLWKKLFAGKKFGRNFEGHCCIVEAIVGSLLKPLFTRITSIVG